MLNCIQFDNSEVQGLYQRSGLSEFSFKSQLRHFTSRHGRLPNLDEITDANSEPDLIRQLRLNTRNAGTIEHLKEVTGLKEGEHTFQEAMVILNQRYSDLFISGTQLNDDTYVLRIDHRPTVSQDYLSADPFYDKGFSKNSTSLINSVVGRLSEYLGVKVNVISKDQLNEEFPEVTDKDLVKGFIYKGQIYVVSDNATDEQLAETKLHEMMHLLLGSVKFTNRDVYDGLVGSIIDTDAFKSYFNQSKQTLNDAAEEFLITNLSQHLAGLPNDFFTNLDSRVAYEIGYNLNRLLDTIFMGKYSTKSIPPVKLYNFSFAEVADIVDAGIINNRFQGSLSDAQLSRISANMKATWLKDHKLEQVCE